MKYLADQMIDAGEMLPSFCLPAAGGKVVDLWTYKQHQQVVLLVLHEPACPECRKVLEAFAAYYPVFCEQETEVLALCAAPLEAIEQAQREMRLPFPLLADAMGETLRRLTGWNEIKNTPQPALLVADRYGALYARYTAEREGELPSPDLVLRDLEYIAIQCPECGAPEWAHAGSIEAAPGEW